MCVGQRLGVWGESCDVESGRCGSMTSGLVGEMAFKILPKVAPWVALAVTAFTMLVSSMGPSPEEVVGHT